MALLLMTTQGQINIYWNTGRFFSWKISKGFEDINVYTKQNKDSKYKQNYITALEVTTFHNSNDTLS